MECHTGGGGGRGCISQCDRSAAPASPADERVEMLRLSSYTKSHRVSGVLRPSDSANRLHLPSAIGQPARRLAINCRRSSTDRRRLSANCRQLSESCHDCMDA